MSEPEFQAQLDAVTDALVPLLHELTVKHDFRLLAAVFLEEAALLLQAGVSSGVLTGAAAVQYLTAAIPRVLEPREKKSVVVYSDGETVIGRKN